MKDGCIVSSVILLNLIKKVRFCIPFLLTAIGVPTRTYDKLFSHFTICIGLALSFKYCLYHVQMYNFKKSTR